MSSDIEIIQRYKMESKMLEKGHEKMEGEEGGWELGACH